MPRVQVDKEYWDCDEMATRLSLRLYRRGLAHPVVMGSSDEG